MTSAADLPDDAPKEDALTHVVDLPASPAKLWRALTEPSLVARWLADNDMRAEPGDRFTLKTPLAGAGDVACEILDADPPRLLRYRWRSRDAGSDAPLDTVVSFIIVARPDGGARLTIVHESFAVDATARQETPAAVAQLAPLRRLPATRRTAASPRALRPKMRLAA